MESITVLGIDLAKSVFQLHGNNQNGKAGLRKSLKRRELSEYIVKLPACFIAMEACGGAHFWARKFIAMTIFALASLVKKIRPANACKRYLE